jgi:hypothetical protein
MSHSTSATLNQGEYAQLVCLNPDGTNAMSWFESLPKLLGIKEKPVNQWMITFTLDSLLHLSARKMDEDPIQDLLVAAEWNSDCNPFFWASFMVALSTLNPEMYHAFCQRHYKPTATFNPFENDLILGEEDPAFARTGVDALTLQSAINFYMMDVAEVCTSALAKALPEKIRRTFIKAHHNTSPCPTMFRSILTSLFDTYLRINATLTLLSEQQVILMASTWNCTPDMLTDISHAIDRLFWSGPCPASETFSARVVMLCMQSLLFKRLPHVRDILRDFQLQTPSVNQLSLIMTRHAAQAAQHLSDTEAALAVADHARAMLAQDALAQQFHAAQAQTDIIFLLHFKECAIPDDNP